MIKWVTHIPCVLYIRCKECGHKWLAVYEPGKHRVLECENCGAHNSEYDDIN